MKTLLRFGSDSTTECPTCHGHDLRYIRGQNWKCNSCNANLVSDGKKLMDVSNYQNGAPNALTNIAD